MHDIEPHFRWRDLYTAETDRRSPFYGRTYSALECTNMLYNYYIHPQWDDFGATTLYAKLLYVDYDERYAILELIGEWNDALHNDIQYLKRAVIDDLLEEGIACFALFCDNVLNFHAAEDDYYAEWWEEVSERGGWVALLNTRPQVEEELQGARLQQYIRFGGPFQAVNWRPHKPEVVMATLEHLMQHATRQLQDRR